MESASNTLYRESAFPMINSNTLGDYFALGLGKKEATLDFGVQVSPPTTRAKSCKKNFGSHQNSFENYCIQKLVSSEIIIKGLFVHDASYKSCKEEITKGFRNPRFYINSLDHGHRHFIPILKMTLKGLEFTVKGWWLKAQVNS